MTAKRHTLVAAAALLASAALPAPLLAWGHTGHLLVSKVAIQRLPTEVPAFVRSVSAAQQISELGAEADVSKGTGYVNPAFPTFPNIRTFGTIHDSERDNGHFVDLGDDGTQVLDLVPFAPLLASRQAFDTQIRAASNNATTQYSGYLAYNLVDQWQQIRKDFALIRAFTKAITTATTAADRSFFQYQLQLRQTLTLRDIGYWSHFVGDTSQPMHVSIHFNGWGNYPNPNNYTTAGIHGPFEGAFVKANSTSAAVAALVPASYTDCGCTIEQRTVNYVQASVAQTAALYTVEKLAPGFVGSNAAQVAFANQRLAAAATEMRDLIVFAWRDSVNVTVGFPSIRVSDIEAGTIVLTPTRFAGD